MERGQKEVRDARQGSVHNVRAQKRRQSDGLSSHLCSFQQARLGHGFPPLRRGFRARQVPFHLRYPHLLLRLCKQPPSSPHLFFSVNKNLCFLRYGGGCSVYLLGFCLVMGFGFRGFHLVLSLILRKNKLKISNGNFDLIPKLIQGVPLNNSWSQHMML